jgi:hypothetical protein
LLHHEVTLSPFTFKACFTKVGKWNEPKFHTNQGENDLASYGLKRKINLFGVGARIRHEGPFKVGKQVKSAKFHKDTKEIWPIDMLKQWFVALAIHRLK